MIKFIYQIKNQFDIFDFKLNYLYSSSNSSWTWLVLQVICSQMLKYLNSAYSNSSSKQENKIKLKLFFTYTYIYTLGA